MALNFQGYEMEGSAKVPGQGSHAEGTGTNASGNFAHAEGQATNAYGNYAHTEGSATTVNATAGHAEGLGCSVNGNYAHAEGNNSGANGVAAHAEGAATAASGAQSHSEGNGTVASGISSHAQNDATTASGFASHASGSKAQSTAYGQWSHGAAPISTRSQVSIYHMGCTTANTIARTLTFDGTSTFTLTGATQNVWVIPARACAVFQIQVLGRSNSVTTTNLQGGWLFNGMVVRDYTGNARLLGTTTQTTWTDTTVPGTVALSVVTTDATNNYLAVVVTPATTSAMVWSGTIIATEQYTVN